MLNKMDEQRNVNVNKEEGRLGNELKRTTVKTEKEYFESIIHEIISFQKTVPNNLMYMKKKKELGWKENHEIKNTGIKTVSGI